uniref:Hist_deacetyl domain-containing protein n=1 Tax=Angiostrongylus cantonensis TaxID=6313 RepID=A0A0K0CVS2_ANGCA
LIFHEIYDVKFFGLEKCHPFDSGKWGKVHAKLKSMFIYIHSFIYTVGLCLSLLCTVIYLASLYSPCVLAKVIEVPIACLIPTCITDKYFLKRMRYQCGGTVAACRIALDRGWAVHLGGGFHHAYRSSGGGFCVYADISLALKILFGMRLIEKAMIIDLDAHQGNGHERDFGNDERVFILDVYNPRIYPRDHQAERGISRSVHVGSMTSDAEYLRLVKRHFSAALSQFKCDLVVYNAGTDSLDHDPLGCLSLSQECIIRRDELVFDLCRQNETPIAMLTSGGYLMESANTIACSVRNLHEKQLIQLKT